MSQTSLYRVSVKALIMDSNSRLLFVEEKEGNGFELPGGGMENGETARQALERELDEELHSKLVNIGNAPTFVWIINGEVIWLLFEASISNSGNFSTSEHVADAGFYSPPDLYCRVEHGLGYCTKTNYKDLLAFLASRV